MRQKSILFLFVLPLFEVVNGQDKFATQCKTPNNELGFCVEIQDCKILWQQVVEDNKESFEFIRSSHCGPPNENTARPKVCCGSETNFIHPVTEIVSKATDSTILTSTTTTPLPPSGHSVLPRICGKQKVFFESKIFGGREAGIGEFPWLARLVHYSRYNRTGLGCSGFLIHRKFILTAAHCLVGKGIEHLGPIESVILGVHNDTKARICVDQGCTDSPQNIETLTPIIHEQYEAESHTHDIALVPLKSKITFTDFIKAICLSRTSTNSEWFTISGWGRTETGPTSRTKLKAELPRVNISECTVKYRMIGQTLTDNQICAGGEPGRDTCAGDSGGPLMAMGDENLWYAEGIVSYGNSCGMQGWPGVYTYIPKYYDWIVENIKTFLKR